MLIKGIYEVDDECLSSSKFGTTAIAIVIGSFALFLGVARSAGAPVRAAYSAISGAMGPLWVAHDMGIFSRHGLEVQLLYIGGGSLVTQALLGGDGQAALEMAGVAEQRGHRVLRYAHGAQRDRAVCRRRPRRGPVPQRRRLEDDSEHHKSPGIQANVEAGNQISSGSQRQNHRCHAPGRSTDFALDLALKKWGLRRGTDVAVLQTGGMPQLLGAIKSGPIDAGVISPPTNLHGRIYRIIR